MGKQFFPNFNNRKHKSLRDSGSERNFWLFTIDKKKAQTNKNLMHSAFEHFALSHPSKKDL